MQFSERACLYLSASFIILNAYRVPFLSDLGMNQSIIIVLSFQLFILCLIMALQIKFRTKIEQMNELIEINVENRKGKSIRQGAVRIIYLVLFYLELLAVIIDHYIQKVDKIENVQNVHSELALLQFYLILVVFLHSTYQSKKLNILAAFGILILQCLEQYFIISQDSPNYDLEIISQILLNSLVFLSFPILCDANVRKLQQHQCSDKNFQQTSSQIEITTQKFISRKMSNDQQNEKIISKENKSENGLKIPIFQQLDDISSPRFQLEECPIFKQEPDYNPIDLKKKQDQISQFEEFFKPPSYDLRAEWKKNEHKVDLIIMNEESKASKQTLNYDDTDTFNPNNRKEYKTRSEKLESIHLAEQSALQILLLDSNDSAIIVNQDLQILFRSDMWLQSMKLHTYANETYENQINDKLKQLTLIVKKIDELNQDKQKTDFQPQVDEVREKITFQKLDSAVDRIDKHKFFTKQLGGSSLSIHDRNSENQSFQNALLGMTQIISDNTEFIQINQPFKQFIITFPINPDDGESQVQQEQKLVILYFIEIFEEINIAVVLKDISKNKKIIQLNQIIKYNKTMLNNTAHEMRTPLNCIICMLEQSCKMIHDEGLKQTMLYPALSSSKILSSFIHELLDDAQNSVGKFELNIQEIKLKSFFDDIFLTMNVIVRPQGNQLSLNFDDNVPQTFFTDPIRLRQVIINLIGNANQFTRNGSISINLEKIQQQIQLSQIKKICSEEIIKISVVDTGAGIDPKKMDRLFKQFGKLDDSSGINAKGIGLGLVISKKIVFQLSQQKSTLKVSSDGLKMGSTFYFNIHNFREDISDQEHIALYNFNKLEEEQQSIMSGSEHSDGAQIQRTQTQLPLDLVIQSSCNCCKYLIVDDSYFNCYALSFILDSMNMRNEYVLSGVESENKVIEKFEKAECCIQYDIIFLDIDMPDQNGIETAQHIEQIKESQQMERTIIVACTGFSSQEDKDIIFASGIQHFLSKPVNQQEILIMIEQINNS